MKKMIKKTSALAISAFMLAQYVPFSAVAYTSTTSDLTIHPYVISESAYNTRKAAGSAGLTGTTDDKPASSEGLDTYVDNSLTFTIISVDANGVADGATSLTGQLSNTAINLPDGKYKIIPENNDTDAKFKAAEAIYIQVPVAATKDVHIYPKFTDNQDNNDTNDPTVTPDTNTDPQSDNKHCIKLTKTLSDTPASHNWTTTDGQAGFNAYFKNQLGNWEKVMNAAGTAAQVYYTNTNGEVIIDGLPLGEYCLVEVDAPNGYLLNSKPVTFSLKGGSGVDGNKQTDSMVNDKELTVKKEIAYDNGNGYGQTYKWTITADVPSHPENLIKYEITDDFTNLKNVAFSIEGFTENTDYTVATSGTKKTISITDPTALTGTSLVISVTSELADGVAENTAVTNKASIEYSYAYDPGTNDPTDIPEPDPTVPYPAPINYPADPTNPDPDTVATFTPKTITISNVDSTNTSTELTGSFNITNFSIHVDDSNDAATLDDGDKTDSLLTLKNLAPGIYTITQKSTQSGYSIANPDTQTIFIAENGKVYNGDAAVAANEITAEADGSYKITFLNDPVASGFNLPFTGTTATIVFSITGILLMAGTAFFIFIILKKRDDDEEEQENN